MRARPEIERLEAENQLLRRELDQAKKAAAATTPAPASGIIPTADTTLQAMGDIMAALSAGRISAVDAKTQLYAHQIALSAIRTLDTAKAQRQKEERLRKTTTKSKSPIQSAPTASPKRQPQRPNPKKKRKKNIARRPTNSKA